MDHAIQILRMYDQLGNMKLLSVFPSLLKRNATLLVCGDVVTIHVQIGVTSIVFQLIGW
jgi:hypothetical protein